MTEYEREQYERLKTLARYADAEFERARIRHREAQDAPEVYRRKVTHVPGPFVPATQESAARDTARWRESRKQSA